MVARHLGPVGANEEDEDFDNADQDAPDDDDLSDYTDIPGNPE